MIEIPHIFSFFFLTEKFFMKLISFLIKFYFLNHYWSLLYLMLLWSYIF